MKFRHILVCCLTNFSKMFLAQYWRLETSSRPFMILFKWKYNKSWPFLIVYIYHLWLSFIHLLKKMKHWNLEIIGYWVTGTGCLIGNDLELSPSLSSCSEDSWKLLPLLVSINCLSKARPHVLKQMLVRVFRSMNTLRIYDNLVRKKQPSYI